MKHLTFSDFEKWASKIHPVLFGSGTCYLQSYGYWDNEKEYGRWNNPAQLAEFLTDSFTSSHYTLLSVSLKNYYHHTVSILTPDSQAHNFLQFDEIVGPSSDGYMIPYTVNKVITCTNGNVFYAVSALIADHCAVQMDYVAADAAIFYRRSWPHKICDDCGILYCGDAQQLDTSDCPYHA